MLKLVVAAALAITPLALVTAPGASAAVAPTHTLVVSGTGVGMYPAYDGTVRRYAATTTEDTFLAESPSDNTINRGASVTVHATTSDPHGKVLVDGVPLTSRQIQVGKTLHGLDSGDEISVIYVDSGGREADSVFVLPADFPTLTASFPDPQGQVTPGQVGLTLSQWAPNGMPQFDTAVDTHGVPSWVFTSHAGGLDLKRQPNGSYTETRPTSTQGRTGSDVVEMDSQFKTVASHRTVGLVNTDGHDSILEPDGSRVLLAYEPNPQTGKTDSVIQEVDPQGVVTFQWDSSALAGESVVSGADYAHINSVEIVNGGQDFLASFRNLDAVIEIARVAHDEFLEGDIIWKLGGRDSSFSFVDDPFDGPCGQHTASELPNGDIMVFDDGSINFFGALCVDSADPTGPVHERPQSRLAVWHLDAASGTATLVRSYGPTGWFGWFMGSTQYLPQTGHTLIGWASATNAVATELDQGTTTENTTPVWQLVASPSSNLRTYFSYRSLKFDAPDAIDPVVRVTAPAAGDPTYRYGEHVPVAFSCSDKGGSTLQTCGSVVPGTLLDTTTPGVKTFTVTASDGAGNTRSVVRHFTVIRPDLSVQRANGTWLGAGVFGHLASQTTRRSTHAGTTVTVPFRLANQGNTSDRCLVHGTGGSKNFIASYRSAGSDVTDRVVAGTWRTPATAPGARQMLTLRVHVARGAARGVSRTFTVRCGSTHASTVTDGAGLRATVSGGVR